MCRAPVGLGAKRTRMARTVGTGREPARAGARPSRRPLCDAPGMLIGAHVSPAGGPAKAIERGRESGSTAIQIFNQNPRAWKPTEYAEDAVAAFHAAQEG